jgi:hypothetical protein
MKSSGQIMQELGFNKNSSDSAKAAFLKHLFKAATGCEVQSPNFDSSIKKVAPPGMQLSFDLDSASFQEAI